MSGASVVKTHVVSVAGWEKIAWLRHGFSLRAGGRSTIYAAGRSGELNLGYTREDDPDLVAANRQLFRDAVMRSPTREGQEQPKIPPLRNDTNKTRVTEMVTVRQVHGVVIKKVERGETGLTGPDGRGVFEADGLITDSPGVLLAIQVADCVPVLLVDVERKAVGAFHAGWRGTAAGILEQGVARMRQAYGSRPEDMIAAVGPAIGGCCYTVGEEVRQRFAKRFAYTGELFQERSYGLHLDLAEANRRQLLASGLSDAHIVLLGECTACAREDGSRKYFSHREEKGFTGRAMGAVAVAAYP